MNTLIFLIATILAVFVLMAFDSRNRRSFFDPGVLIVLLFAFCYLLPTLAVQSGLDVAVVTDDRGVVELLSLYGILFVLSFTFFYLRIGVFFDLHKAPNSNVSYSWNPRICFALMVMCFVVQKVILAAYGVGSAGDYSDQYILRAEMAAEVSQFINLMGGVILISTAVFLCAAMAPSNYGNRRVTLLIAVTFVIYLVDMALTQARSNLITFIFLFVGVFSFYRSHIGLVKEILFSIILLLSMSLFALFRSSEFSSDYSISWITIVIPSEFISIYNNALQLLMIAESIDYVGPPGISYWQSLIAFIPKQFNPDKWDLALWYVSEYFPFYLKSGGGLAFGIIPEAIVNFGLVSIVFQAFVIAVCLKIGFIFGWRYRYLGANIFVLLYFFIFSLIYQLIRSNSFVIVSSIILGFLIPFIVISATLYYIHGKAIRARPVIVDKS
jgi:oligosaccharide repeat unit polymerase